MLGPGGRSQLSEKHLKLKRNPCSQNLLLRDAAAQRHQQNSHQIHDTFSLIFAIDEEQLCYKSHKIITQLYCVPPLPEGTSPHAVSLSTGNPTPSGVLSSCRPQPDVSRVCRGREPLQKAPVADQIFRKGTVTPFCPSPDGRSPPGEGCLMAEGKKGKHCFMLPGRPEPKDSKTSCPT